MPSESASSQPKPAAMTALTAPIQTSSCMAGRNLESNFLKVKISKIAAKIKKAIGKCTTIG